MFSFDWTKRAHENDSSHLLIIGVFLVDISSIRGLIGSILLLCLHEGLRTMAWSGVSYGALVNHACFKAARAQFATEGGN